eukprot:CAMPEP_0184298654 /NCGR_PEP_ID=MMETSP1049-20130417/9422_1 /TAXON_ID=77928 /ORGANISM="Proteomonas sulcata, Strain CCMP704" /LENGTH=74 /DNA_ID=CAMNT_0026608847 /DNA_START=126 /DNA_END=350 /DNA_ORIENTATION=-
MAWFQWTVEEFEETQNPTNCGMAVMERIPHEDRYRLNQTTCKMLGLDAVKGSSSQKKEVPAWPDRFLKEGSEAA